MSDRMQGYPSPIPGGQNHLTNAQTFRQKVPIPDSAPEIKDLNAHGVEPGTHTAMERADFEQGPHEAIPRPEYAAPAKPQPSPVPVYNVENPHKGETFRSGIPRHFTVPANTGDAVRLCGRDFNRSHIYLMNEDGTNAIRFAQNPAALTNGGGAILPAAMGSYLRLSTQDELWALSATSTGPVISVIQEFDHAL